MSLQPHVSLRAAFALLCAMTLVIGCAPASETGGEVVFGPVEFQVPDENADLVAAYIITVGGPGVARVRIVVGEEVVYDSREGPFEYTIDAPNLPTGRYSMEITASHESGSFEERASVNFKVSRERPPFQEMRDAITNLTPGQWYEIPVSEMRLVDWADGLPTNRGDQAAIITAASGGTFDTQRDRLVVWGSGGDVYRNDLYAFDMNTLEWIRLTDPSPFPPGQDRNAEDKPTHNDGAPVSRHSYDVVEYVPGLDRLYVGGGPVDGQNSLFDDNQTYLFNFDTLTWTPGQSITSVGFGSHSAVHPDGTIWQHGGGGQGANHLGNFDPVAQSYIEHVFHPGFYNFEATADIDPTRNLYIAVGNRETRIWDLDNPDLDSTVLNTTGATEIENETRPGMVYHAASDRIVAWTSQRDVYVLNIDTGVWTKVIGTGDDNPGQQTARGQSGRWRYSAKYDVFVCVTSVDKNVFVYRLPENPDSPE